jgi:trans-aconitate methyltransferase
VDRADLDEMQAAGERMARRLSDYFESFPESLADVGCGPAHMLFELAPEHPESDFVGFDAAKPIVQDNRSRAANRDIGNLTFHCESLPDFSADREFECITSIATLHYVADIETAITRLLAHLKPEGVLIFNYPNRHTRQMYRTDPETNADRFELVLDGENLLTQNKIRRITNRQPESFWKAVNEDDWRAIGQTNPCVILRK